MALTREEIECFLTTKIGFCNFGRVLAQDRVQFLKILIRKHVTSIYFHNLENASTPVENRQLPSPRSIQLAMKEGRGGTCYQLNYFLKLILDGLGFETFMIATIGSLPGNHMAIVVSLLLDKESYLLDVGSANPLSWPVPLHALPFSRKCGGFSYEFRKVAENEVARYQIGSGLFFGEYTGDTTERLRLKFDLTPREFDYFNEPMEVVYKDMKRSAVCRNLYLFRHFYSKNGMPCLTAAEEAEAEANTEFSHDLDFIWIFGYHVLIGAEVGKSIYKFSNYLEMISIVNKYFPNLDHVTLMTAIKALEPVEQYQPNF